jgi:glycosyltransferase involved in cell wall biosynthesis
VAGDAAILVSPRDTAQLGQALARVLDDDALRQQLVRKGLDRVTRFSWEKCAQQTLEVLQAAGSR